MDLVIDHSVQVDETGTPRAYQERRLVHERPHDPQLLPVPLRELADARTQLQVQALREIGGAREPEVWKLV